MRLYGEKALQEGKKKNQHSLRCPGHAASANKDIMCVREKLIKRGSGGERGVEVR